MFRKVVGQCIYIVMVYVDDILVCTKIDELECIKRALINEFKWITMRVSKSYFYLGMQPMISEGKVKVDMQVCIEKILAD